jgi:hypothetical protein
MCTCERFWHGVRHKLGKLRRLDHRDCWQVEALIAKKVPKPQASIA